MNDYTPEEQKLHDENIRAILQWEKNVNAEADEEVRKAYGTIVMYLVRGVRYVYVTFISDRSSLR